MALMATRTKVLLHKVVKNGGAFGKVGAMRSSSTAVVESRPVGLGVLGLKDYEDYRRSLYGEITHKALLVDAAGTLLVPSQPMAQVPPSLSLSLFLSLSDMFLCMFLLCLYVIFGLVGLIACVGILGTVFLHYWISGFSLLSGCICTFIVLLEFRNLCMCVVVVFM